MNTGTRGTLSLALQEVLADIEEFLEDREDAEYFTDSPYPVPNKAKSLLIALKQALGELP